VQFRRGDEGDWLSAATRPIRADVVVMTQACDLEHSKVRNLVLCPHLPISEYRHYWEEAMLFRNQQPTERAWRNHSGNIREGFLWNLSILNAGGRDGLETEHRIVDFHEVYSAPRLFVQSVIRCRGLPRLRLLPPYREHLSQAFARFFMRVGLPIEVRPIP
jgi:hypothetical protein